MIQSIKIMFFALLFVGLSYSSQLKARVIYVVGQASVNSKPIKVGVKVQVGDTLRVTENSYVDLNLQNGTAVRIQESSVVVIQHNDLKKVRIDNQKGGLLNIVRSGLDYQVNAKTATAAVRGTIFYVQTNESSLYFCSCNGHVHYSNLEYSIELDAEHHAAVQCTETSDFENSTMKSHTDLEIFSLMHHLSKSEKSTK